MIRWNSSKYQFIKNVETTSKEVVVSFENGDVIALPKSTLIPFGYENITQAAGIFDVIPN